jgi:nucleoside-diphosphate-sugar epimerase
MQVFIAGATGVLGRRLVALCTDRGHDVVGLTRDPAGDEVVRDAGGEPRRGDVLERDSIVEAATGADVLVHAATKIPTETDPDEEDWARNDRVRREGAENLVAAAVEHDADRVVLQSVVWVARQPDGSQFDEGSEPHPDRSTRSALAAERIVRDGAAEGGYEPVVLRGGYFYAADTAHTKLFGERLLDRRLPVIAGGLLGRDDAELSFVHVDDAASAFAAAADGEATGTFHVVDDRPMTYAAFLRTFAERLDAPAPRRVPAWLAGFAIDDNVRRLLTRSMPTSNDRFRDAFDWEPEYPTVERGLDRVVSEWERSGEVVARES